MDSQAIVNTMEVLETKSITELVSEAIIKVCYVSETPNPNLTVINREVGKQIAASLPGAPVVGFFNPDTGDFVEHSRQIVIKEGNIEFKDLTRPYGFVSFEQPWYQDFIEEGEVRTYLMCKAYLWTRQYQEASLAFNKGQSMELDENTMSGYYEGSVFVFTEATLDRLCILGDAYAPCFSGAKIMTTYAKGYEDLATQVEKIIGRRYYVMDGQLMPKPEIVTLDYALQLGWDLEDTVYAQLEARGEAEKYWVKGIFTEDGSIFAILQERESLEYIKVGLTITDKDSVELGQERVAVQMTWTPKENPASQSTVQVSYSATEPAPATAYAMDNQNLNNPATEPAPAATEPTTQFTQTPAAEPAPAPAAEPATEPAATFSATEPAGEPAAEPATEPVGDPAPATEPAAEPAPAAEPEVDYAAKFAELSAQVETLNQTITNLNGQLEQYKTAEAAAIETQKNEMVTSYRALLTEEEMQPVLEKMSEYSLDDLEAKLSVVYTRKQRAAQPATNYQLDVNAPAAQPVDNLPDFMKQAMEFDKQNNGIVL